MAEGVGGGRVDANIGEDGFPRGPRDRSVLIHYSTHVARQIYKSLASARILETSHRGGMLIG